jgi:hypothetical protein
MDTVDVILSCPTVEIVLISMGDGNQEEGWEPVLPDIIQWRGIAQPLTVALMTVFTIGA